MSILTSDSITTEHVCKTLNGIEYPTPIPSHFIKQCTDAGIVIVYGQSDDLMEFEGAITDEIEAYEGHTAYLDANGLLLNDCQRNDCPYFSRLCEHAIPIDAIWNENANSIPGISWTFKTEIPHLIFNIMEEGDIYCKGIVFTMRDLRATFEEKQAVLQAELSTVQDLREALNTMRQPSCGHDESAIVSDKEGTCYCGVCETKARDAETIVKPRNALAGLVGMDGVQITIYRCLDCRFIEQVSQYTHKCINIEHPDYQKDEFNHGVYLDNLNEIHSKCPFRKKPEETSESQPKVEPLIHLSQQFTQVQMDPNERAQAVSDAHYRTLSPHEWEWTKEQQARMAQYCLWAAQRIVAMKTLYQEESITGVDRPSNHELVRRAIKNVKPPRGASLYQRWVAVMYLFAVGSTTAFILCNQAGVDPDEYLPERYCEGCPKDPDNAVINPRRSDSCPTSYGNSKRQSRIK